MANIQVQSLASPLDILVNELAEPCFYFRRILVEHPVKSFYFFLSKEGTVELFPQQDEQGIDSQLVRVVGIGIVVDFVACLYLWGDDVWGTSYSARDELSRLHLEGVSEVNHLRPDIGLKYISIFLDTHQYVADVDVGVADIYGLDPSDVFGKGYH